ncbi:aminotransferase class IV, partial [Candidatus Peregrinibacteria bacterium]|nr:aminotransferase class IV [Candidatus Peregrinibacteria bacterium]
EERLIWAEGKLEAIYATSVLKGVTGLHPHKPNLNVPEKLQGLPRHPVNSLTAAVYKDGKWTQTHVLPDGDADWLVGGFDNTTTQYGQAAFEGMVGADETPEEPESSETPESPEAPDVELEFEAEVIDGKVTIFRPEENARRFIRSCLSIGIPPISVNQFIRAVLAAVENNREFIPKNGKLYIRPYVRGLKGGTGVKPAKNYQFAVEVSPFGSYLAEGAEDPEILPGIAVKEVNFNRADSSRGKISGSYSPTFKPKIDALAKTTLTGTSFKDIILVGNDDEYQECASSNIFFVRKVAEGHFEVSTPSLMKNILPGITRNSLLKLLNDSDIAERLGVKLTAVDDQPLSSVEALRSTGAFSTGTAAGITNINYISTRSGAEIEYSDRDTQKFIKKLSDLLNDARRGKVPGYESWVMEV